MIAVCTPVTVVPRSLATVAIDTFITDVSRVMRNWPVASVKRMRPAPAFAAPAAALPAEVVSVAIVPPGSLPAACGAAVAERYHAGSGGLYGAAATVRRAGARRREEDDRLFPLRGVITGW